MIELRPYQQRVLADLWAWFEANGDGDPIVEACVGAGKSVLIAEMCRRSIEQAPGTRILMVTHVKELIQQNTEKLLHVWPDAPVGIYSASAGSRQIGRAITYATIGSVYKRAHELGHVDIVLVDEAHMISPNEATMYRRLIDELRALCPLLRVVGWTGTAFRGDGVWLTQQGLFTHVASRVTMRELLADGYLAPLVTAPTETHIDTAGVRLQGGDYVVSELARASGKAELITKACAELVRLAVDRKRWLVFAVTVEHAHHLSNELRQAHGIACAVVSAKTPVAERDATIRAFRAGRLRAVVNVAVLTTGFDVPDLDCIALLRATKSPVLYVQIAGRGMRTAPGKTDCIAEGQRVLTDHGLVAIENVTREMRVWDGAAFVEHYGTVCKGEQDVITYAGLTATSDHRVWTSRGWVRFGECAESGLRIAVGGDGRTPVRASDRYFRGCDGHQGEQVPASALHRLRKLWRAARRQLAQADGWMQTMWQPTGGPALAAQAVRGSIPAVHESEQHELRTVRRPRDSLRVRLANRHGGMGAEELGARPYAGDRPDRQRAGVQARESATVDTAAKHIAHAQDGYRAAGACVQVPASAGALRRQHSVKAFRFRLNATRDRGAMGSTVMQTKRRVWDLLNAGPLHRFTCEGLIVSNCLWLDFTDTTATLGPVDAIRGKARKPATGSKGSAPLKYCDHCGNPNPTAVLACTHCGQLFPEPERVTHATVTSSASVLSGGAPVWHSITRVGYRHHEGREGKPDTLRVDYFSGWRMVASEWVCLEHMGYARAKAEQWWRTRSSLPAPATVDEALERTAELREPGRIAVQMDGKYPRIVGIEWPLQPQEAAA